ncbi:hypothetical protein HG263_21725 [Pseudoalteromonas sp. JBTF-M23]|uniref:Helix-turn-helix protein n=1 Tax=Pseudoalteromonas caenipelagi TaxID=2726988 RepID=A0A849VN38_9GAMM|nr:hypothetical protein [Pseudoalteromonas caenipelagi]NOU53124.1 hypothetical protein [Pseudoalteromonas caenipelagi]
MSHFLIERNRLGYTQESIAERLEVNRKTVGRWDNGAPIPSDKLAICLDLGFDITFVLTGRRSSLEIANSAELTAESAIQAAVYATEEAILSVYQVKRVQKQLGVNGEFDAVKNLTLIKKAAEVLARAELTGDFSQDTLKKVFEMAGEA